MVDVSPDAVVAATAAYSGGCTQMPPTTTNCGACGLLLLWIGGLGLLVCKRYF